MEEREPLLSANGWKIVRLTETSVIRTTQDGTTVIEQPKIERIQDETSVNTQEIPSATPGSVVFERKTGISLSDIDDLVNW